MTSIYQKRLNSALNSINLNKLDLKLDNKFFKIRRDKRGKL